MSRRPYVRPVSKRTWYMRNGRYKVYMLREMTSFIVALYSFLTIYALAVLATDSAERWNAFLAAQQSTGMIIFHALALLYFLLYQTFPWFKLAPKAMPVQLGEFKLPGSFIVIGHYAVWLALTAFIFWLAEIIG